MSVAILPIDISNNLSLIEAIDMAQNRLLWRLMSTFDTMHFCWCMSGKKKTVFVN